MVVTLIIRHNWPYIAAFNCLVISRARPAIPYTILKIIVAHFLYFCELYIVLSLYFFVLMICWLTYMQSYHFCFSPVSPNMHATLPKACQPSILGRVSENLHQYIVLKHGRRIQYNVVVRSNLPNQMQLH